MAYEMPRTLSKYFPGMYFFLHCDSTELPFGDEWVFEVV
jgi:hypothetical protein